MKVKQLIEHLSEQDPDDEVCVWAGYERYAIDPSGPLDSWSPGFVDINIEMNFETDTPIDTTLPKGLQP